MRKDQEEALRALDVLRDSRTSYEEAREVLLMVCQASYATGRADATKETAERMIAKLDGKKDA